MTVIQKNWLSYADVTRVKWLLTHHIPSRMGIDCAAIEFRHRNFPLWVITVTTHSRCTLRSPWQSAERSTQKAETTVTCNRMVHIKIMPLRCECFRKRCCNLRGNYFGHCAAPWVPPSKMIQSSCLFPISGIWVRVPHKQPLYAVGGELFLRRQNEKVNYTSLSDKNKDGGSEATDSVLHV
jgi:hypothetical protein